MLCLSADCKYLTSIYLFNILLYSFEIHIPIYTHLLLGAYFDSDNRISSSKHKHQLKQMTV